MKKKETEPETQPEQTAPQEDYYDQLIRLKADFENYRKRVDREKPELVAFGRQQMLLQLLPVYETMLKAKSHLDKQDTGELRKGLELVFKEFEKVFAGENVEVMDCVGKPYDPMRHEVLAALDCGDDKDGLVIEEAAKGFTCCGKVIVPAKVCIGKKREAPQEQPPAEEK
ncbi:MAG: nucleotide exchange factor GrpE [Elusimicrobiales bacterium]